MPIEWRFLHSVQTFRTPVGDVLMHGLAKIFAAGACTIWAGVIALFLLVYKRQIEAALLFFGTLIGATLSTVLKNIFRRPRPHFGEPMHSYSFPSGHALISVVFFGLLALLAVRHDPKRRRLYQSWAGFMIFLMGADRLYLGVHWPTDVLGGWAIGGLFLWAWTVLGARVLG